MRKRFFFGVLFLSAVFAPSSGLAFSDPQVRSISQLASLPQATHHGVLITIDPVIDPNLQSFKVEVSRDSGARWVLFSKDIRPYDNRHIILPYRTKDYGLATNVAYQLKVCANYGSEIRCGAPQTFSLPVIAARNAAENQDADDDILPSLTEYNLGTDPRNPDSDDDQMADGFETGRNLDPNFTERPSIKAEVSFLDFGEGVPNGFRANQHRVITITNAGERVLRISNGLFSGANPEQFKFLNAQLEIASLPPNQSREVAIDFLPVSLGPQTASFDILSDDLAHFPVSITLSGAGSQIAHLRVDSESRLDFGAAPVGSDSIHKKITISNPDSDRTMEVSLFLRNTLNFVAVPNRLNVPAGDSREVQVFFTPEWVGTHEGMLEIRGANTADENLVQISITAEGTGSLPSPRLQTGAVVFGGVNRGSESKRQLIVYNDGDGVLYLKKIDFGRDGDGGQNGFRVSSHNLIVPPNGSSRIEITFKPDAQRPYTSQLCLVTNAGSQPASLSACNVVRPIGQGVNFPNASHAIRLSGVGM